MDISKIINEVRAKLKASKSETIDDLLIAIEKGEVDEYDRLTKHYAQLSVLSDRLEGKISRIIELVGEVVDIAEQIN